MQHLVYETAYDQLSFIKDQRMKKQDVSAIPKLMEFPVDSAASAFTTP